jgi:hypothetical protein
LPTIPDGWDSVAVDALPTKVSGELPKLFRVAELKYRLDIEDAGKLWSFVMPVTVRVGGDVEL